MVTRWHFKVLKLCLLVEFLLKLLACFSFVLRLKEEDPSQPQGDTTVYIDNIISPFLVTEIAYCLVWNQSTLAINQSYL